MLAIFKREFKSYFQSVIGWLYIAVTLAIFGLYFTVYNMSYGYGYVSYTVSAISFLFLITTPVLTMRILAEERNRKTDQLILTSPVSVGKIVVAKYLSMAAIFTICVLVMCLAPVFLSAFGKVALPESYTAILGFWLYGLSCIAIGTFVSSLTESQVISAVVTFVFLFLGYMMGGITNMISAGGNLLTKILGCYDLTAHLDQFCSGILDVTGIVYYLSLIFLFLFFTVQSIQKRRWSIGTGKLKLGVFSIGMILVNLAIVVVINLAVVALPEKVTSIDITNEKLYTLTKDTKNFLKDMEDDITIYVLSAKDTLKTQDKTLYQTLENYKDTSSHIKVVYKDPKVSPQFYSNYTDTAPSANSVIVESAKRFKIIDYSSLYETNVNYQTYSQETTGYDGEGQITSAISYVTSEEMPVIYQITGHGETALSSAYTDAIEKANVTLKQLTLLKEETVPEDAAAIIVNGPTEDFSSDDAAKLSDYLKNGGKAFITTGYTEKELPNFEAVLAEYNLSLAKGIVVETNSDGYYQSPFYLLPEIGYSEWTSDVMNNYVFSPYCRGITHPQTEEDGEITYTDLLNTKASAFSKTDVANMNSIEKEDGDVDGPFAIGVEVEKKVDEENTTQLFVFASAEMFTDNADQMVAGNNSKLFTSCIKSFTSSEDTDGAVVIPVKEYDTAKITVSAMTVILCAVGFVILLPVVLLGIGIGIWAVRRKK